MSTIVQRRTAGVTALFLLLYLMQLVLFSAAPARAAGGDFSLDFIAAAPESYDHTTGGGAYDDRTIGVGADTVESLEGGDFACGDIVTYFVQIEVDDTEQAGADGEQTIRLDFAFLADTTGQSGVAIGDVIDENVQINYGTIQDLIPGENDVDDGINDDEGSTATIVGETLTGPLFTAGSELLLTVEIDDLERAETVVLRLDVKLFCQPGSNPTGNLQADLNGKRLMKINGDQVVSPPDSIPGGRQTVPFKHIGDIEFPASALTVTKTADPTSLPEPGGPVTFTVVVANTGDAALNLSDLTDDVYGDITAVAGSITATTCAVPQSIAVGGDYSCSFSANVTGNAGFSETDTVTATAQGPDGLDLTAQDSATVTITDVLPTIAVTKTADPTTVQEPGGNVTFTVVVANNSIEEVTITSLTDSIYGTLDGDGDCQVGTVLAPAASCSFEFTEAVTGNVGDTHTNVVTASAQDDEGNTATANDNADVVFDDILPQITVVKVASPTEVAEPGGPVTYTVTVTNDTVEPVTITELSDDKFGTLTGDTDCQVGTQLAGLGSCSFDFVESLVGQAGVSHTNIVTAKAVDDEENEAVDTDDATVTFTDVASSIVVTKTASPESVDEPGGSVTFTVVVANTSPADSVTIDTLNDSVYGDLNGQGTCSVPQTIPAGGAYQCSFSATVTGQPDDSHTNVVTASGQDDDGNPVSDSDDATVTVTDLPSVITVTKTADQTTLPEPGGAVTYTVTVTNDSEVDSVTINTLIDDKFGDLAGKGTCAVPQTLAANGGSYSCEFVGDVTGDPGFAHTNVVVATGVDDDGNELSDSDSETVTITGLGSSIVVTKVADPTSLPEPGGDVLYSVTIQNTSLVDSVTIDSLVDDKFGDLDQQGDCAVPQTILPGDTYSCQFTGAVSGQPDDSHTNVVTASGEDDDGDPVSGSDSATVDITDVPSSIEVIKTPSPSSVRAPGGTVTYTVIVTNTSAVDTVVIDSLVDDVFGDLNGLGDCTVGDGGIVLEPGESYSCSFAEEVTGTAGSTHTNVVTVEGVDDDETPVSDSDSADVLITSTPPSNGGPDPASIGDYVWFDIDGDGIQDSNESGIDGVTVRLLDLDGDVLAFTTTDADGKYLFDDLDAGTYRVQFLLPDLPGLDNEEFTLFKQGLDGALDSDVDLSGGTAPIQLSNGEDERDIDAGVRVGATVGGVTVTTSTTIPVVSPDTLPFTGFDGQDGFVFGLVLLAAGGLVLFAAGGRREEAVVVETIGGWSNH